VAWIQWFENWINVNIPGSRVPFKMAEPSGGGCNASEMGPLEGWYAHPYEEFQRFGNVGLVCALARAFIADECREKDKEFTFSGQTYKNWGRVIMWCKKLIGASGYMVQKVKTKKRKADQAAMEEEELGLEDIDPFGMEEEEGGPSAGLGGARMRTPSRASGGW